MRWVGTLRVLIPASLAAVGMALIVVGFWQNVSMRTTRSLATMSEACHEQGTRLAGIFQHLMRRGLRQTADLEMSYASNTPDLELGLVCDADNIVCHATQLQWRGVPLGGTPLAEVNTIISKAKESMTGIVERSRSGGRLWSVYPFLDSDSKSKATVILAFDADGPVRDAFSRAVHASISQAFFLAAGCLLLWFGLDEIIARRVARIIEYAGLVARGLHPAPPVSGVDEVAEVGRALVRTVASLRNTERQLVESSEQERHRIGVELHDDVCQRITAAQLKAGVLASALKKSHFPQLALASQIADDLSLAAELARGCARGLAPVALHQQGLKVALEGLAAHLTHSFGVEVSVECDAVVTDRMTETQTGHLFRIAQELATNAAKHASPKVVVIRICAAGEMLRLEVENDGNAFTPDDGPSHGLGLHLVRQRAGILGGELVFLTPPSLMPVTIARVDVPRTMPQGTGTNEIQ